MIVRPPGKPATRGSGCSFGTLVDAISGLGSLGNRSSAGYGRVAQGLVGGSFSQTPADAQKKQAQRLRNYLGLARLCK